MSCVICNVCFRCNYIKNEFQKVNMTVDDLDDISRRMTQISFEFEHDDTLTSRAGGPIMMGGSGGGPPMPIEDGKADVKESDEPTEVIVLIY